MGEIDLKNSIKVERARRNMTQADLAFAVGVSRKTINTIETGRFVPTVVTAFRIAQAFNMKIEDIFQFDPLSDD